MNVIPDVSEVLLDNDDSDILLKKHKIRLSRLFCCNHTCYCVNMVSVTPASLYITSASRYHPRYQSRSSMYIRRLIPRNLIRGIGRGSSDFHSSTPSLNYAVAVMSEVFVNKRVDDRVHSIIQIEEVIEKMFENHSGW